MIQYLPTIVVAILIPLIATIYFKNNLVKTIPFLFVSALVCPLVAGLGIRVREVVEGTFGYFDIVFAMVWGMVFVAVLFVNGSFDAIIEKAMSKKSSKLSLAAVLMLIVALPAILTGSALASIFSTGALVGKKMMNSGASKKDTLAFVAISSFIGMVLPPISAPTALAIFARAGSYPAAYVGFFPAIFVCGFAGFLAYLFTGATKAVEHVEAKSSVETNLGLSVLPIIIVSILLLCHELLPGIVPFIGYPLIFAIGTVLAIAFPTKKIEYGKIVEELIKYIPEAVFLFAGGSILEILVLTGVAGTVSVNLLISGVTVLFYIVSILIMVILPYFIGISATTPIIVVIAYCFANVGYGGNYNAGLAGIGAVAALGFFLTAKGGIIAIAANALGLEEQDYSNIKVIKSAIVPLAAVLIVGAVLILFAKSLSFLII